MLRLLTNPQDYTACTTYSILRTQLNDAKSFLDRLSKKEAQMLSVKADMYHNLKYYARTLLNLPFCTNATLKLIEILSVLKIPNPFTVFFNAEFPGAMLSYIIHKRPDCIDWRACSYIGDTALTDTYGLYKMHRSKWLMDNIEGSGDLTNEIEIEKIIHKCLLCFPSGVDLYISDGGVDIKDDFNNQEEFLNLAELLLLNNIRSLHHKQEY